ncbi:hypothetical protein IQ07DRAFT_252994 [Pyrenochaeta sp. DS3sAY3a]|nr:hypothetical protein IQ07DRAFT_252994 [Pyrenochaeta sp. DS3sAY3a]
MAVDMLSQTRKESFKYDILPDQKSIRILNLYPGDWDDPIQCSLSTVNLDDETQNFEAISYAWGEVSGSRKITCNDAELMITKSLHDALQVFRPLRSDGVAARLWADGICIDQGNTSEKNHQVKLMGRIYSGASKVLIWLGHADSALVQECLDMICRLAHVQFTKEYGPQKVILTERDEYYDLEIQYNHRDSWNSAHIIHRPATFVYDSNSLTPLRHLFACEWFQRLWVVQELALSQTAEVFWGNGSIDGRLIGLMVENICDSPDFNYELSRISQHCISLWAMKWAVDSKQKSLHDILRVTRRFDATDPRDKVFGLTGLIVNSPDHPQDLLLEPDYGITKHEVYHQAVRRVLMIDRDVNVLAAVHHGQEIDEDWTSWVPDWARQDTPSYAYWNGKSSGGTRPIISFPDCTICEAKKQYQLSVKGIIIHVVQSLAKDISTSYNLNWEHPVRARYLQRLVNKYHGQNSEESLACTMTPTMNQEHRLQGDRPPLVGMFNAFKTWDITKYEFDVFPHLDLYKENTTRDEAFQFFQMASSCLCQRRVFVTKTGMLGAGPAAVREGDIVVVIFGGSFPFLLRPTADEQHYRLVGECYVHDIMDGQAVKKWQDSGEPATDFHLF